jgi:hypothetical protein
VVAGAITTTERRFSMFSLTKFFEAFRRLTNSVHKTADLFDAANGILEQRLGIDAETIDKDLVVIEAPTAKRISRR